MWARLFCVAVITGCVSDSSANDAGADGSVKDVASEAPGVTCEGGLSACGASCVDVQTDAKNCGACSRSCFGGTCTTGQCQPVTLVTGQSPVGSIAVTSTKLYWARGYTGISHGGIYNSDLDGSNLGVIFDSGPSAGCNSVHVTATDAYFYCTGSLYRCALPSCAGTPTPLVAVSGVGDTVLDTAGNRIFFAVITPYNQTAGGYVGWIPMSGGSISRLTPADQPNPVNILIDSGNAYWLNAGTYTTDIPNKNGGVLKAPLGTNQASSPVATDPISQDYLGLAVQGSTVYYGVGGANAIHSVATIGGSPSTYHASVTGARVNGIVSDATSVYWTEATGVTGGVYQCTLNSCASPKPLAANEDSYPIAQDSVSIVWENGAGEIRRVAK